MTPSGSTPSRRGRNHSPFSPPVVEQLRNQRVIFFVGHPFQACLMSVGLRRRGIIRDPIREHQPDTIPAIAPSAFLSWRRRNERGGQLTDYALRLSEAELARYQFMAESAAQAEADLWAAAGVAEGVAIADIGCGPGAVSAVLGRLVGPTGSVRAVDRDPDVVDAARLTARRAGVDNVTFSVGGADETGIPPASVDLVMIRHVLAHNGSREQAIVDHAATLVRPGGAVYLVDIDMSAFRLRPDDEDLADLSGRYQQWHAQQGNDLSVGLRLGELLVTAGLVDVEHHGHYQIFPVRAGFRPPSWAARDALVAAGLATHGDVERWEAAFVRVDDMELRPTTFVAQFAAFGRRPVGAESGR